MSIAEGLVALKGCSDNANLKLLHLYSQRNPEVIETANTVSFVVCIREKE